MWYLKKLYIQVDKKVKAFQNNLVIPKKTLKKMIKPTEGTSEVNTFTIQRKGTADIDSKRETRKY